MEAIDKNAVYKDVNKQISLLTGKDPFIAYFTSTLNIKLYNEGEIDLPLAAVGLESNLTNFILMINVDAWSKLSNQVKQGVVMHEILHLVFYHLTQFNYLAKDNAKLANVAMDLEINQHIAPELLPSWGIFLDAMCKQYPDANLKTMEGSVSYYNKLRKHLDKNFEIHPYAIHKAQGNGLLDEQGNPVELDADTADYLQKKVEARVEEINKSCKAAGHDISKYDQLIKGFVKPKPVFNYKKYIKTFIENSTEYYVKKSYYKVNYRFPDNPKVILKPKGKILILVDQSGSCSEKELLEYLNDIHHMSKDTPLEIRAFDTEISDVIPYNPRKPEFKRVQCGGTVFKICVDYFEQRKDLTTCIVFTDGYAEVPPATHKNMLWVVTSNGDTSNLDKAKGSHKVLKMPVTN